LPSRLPVPSVDAAAGADCPAPRHRGAAASLLARRLRLWGHVLFVALAAGLVGYGGLEWWPDKAVVPRQVLFTLALGVLLAVALTVGVVEPLVRAARGRWRRPGRQSRELERLALVGQNSTAVVILADAAHRVQWVNPAFTRLAGWSATEVEGALSLELLAHPLADAAALAAWREAVTDGRRHLAELRCRRRDGSDLWLDVEQCPLHDASGRLCGFVTVGHDIGTYVAERLRSAQLWSTLPAGVLVVSAQGDIVDANPAAEQLLGMARESLVGAALRAPSSPLLRDDGSAYADGAHPVQRVLQGGQALHGETMGVRLADGGVRCLRVDAQARRDERGRVAAAVICLADATDRGRWHEPSCAGVRVDRLTGLPNRAVVMERLERALTHARAHPGYGFALLFMDLDRFKQLNDALGEAGGDELLRQIAARLLLALRPGDEVARVDSRTDLAARLGGDEFVVVLEGVRCADTVAAVADRLLRELAEPFNVLDHPVRTSASIGIVLVAEGAAGVEDAAALLRDADTAMYEAKRAGRARRVLFDRSMHERLLHTMALESDLRRALRGDELFVAYQPVIELASGRLSGVEALVRWQHPERGPIGPGEFVPAAEECGLVEDIGRQLLVTACRQFAHWQRRFGERAPATLAVNLSRAQLEGLSLADEVARVLQETGMSAQQLQLEVTEALATQDERVQATLRDLKARGVRLALDDFGTGYSSLACLHRLPVDTVKVDRTFVRNAETVEVHRVLIEATIRVARTLGMTTVAEGIETEGQAELMSSLACDRGQGWLYGRPMTAEELERWLPPAAAGIVVA